MSNINELNQQIVELLHTIDKCHVQIDKIKKQIQFVKEESTAKFKLKILCKQNGLNYHFDNINGLVKEKLVAVNDKYFSSAQSALKAVESLTFGQIACQ